MPDLNLADMGVIGLAVYGIIIISMKLVDVIKTKNNTDSSAEAPQDKLEVLLENNNLAITELTHFLRTQSEVDKEKDRHVEKQLDVIVVKVDKLAETLNKHCLDTKH